MSAPPSPSGPPTAQAELFAEEPRVGEPARLAASRCQVCDRTEFPRRARCPACGGVTNDVAIGPQATVHRFTSVQHQPPGALISAPYVVVAAAYPEGVAVLGVLEHTQLDEVALGDEVETCAVPVGDSIGFGYRLQRSDG